MGNEALTNRPDEMNTTEQQFTELVKIAYNSGMNAGFTLARLFPELEEAPPETGADTSMGNPIHPQPEPPFKVGDVAKCIRDPRGFGRGDMVGMRADVSKVGPEGIQLSGLVGWWSPSNWVPDDLLPPLAAEPKFEETQARVIEELPKPQRATMIFMEAVNAMERGKRCRRPHWTLNILASVDKDGLFRIYQSGEVIMLSTDDIRATDWQVAE